MKKIIIAVAIAISICITQQAQAVDTNDMYRYLSILRSGNDMIQGNQREKFRQEKITSDTLRRDQMQNEREIIRLEREKLQLERERFKHEREKDKWLQSNP